jgi:hypothetical protein
MVDWNSFNPTNAHMNSEFEPDLERLLQCEAVRKIAERRNNEIRFADACRFWRILQQPRPGTVEMLLRDLEDSLAPLDSADAWQLLFVHRFLKERFARHLKLLRDGR